MSGAVCDFRLGYGKALGRTASVVTINRDRQQMLKASTLASIFFIINYIIYNNNYIKVVILPRGCPANSL
jgi:hypothetical protein